MIVVSRDFPLDVVHTSIANLDGVFVANFVEGMCRGADHTTQRPPTQEARPQGTPPHLFS